MSRLLTKAFVEKAIADSAWDMGNEVLYDLCRHHPGHREPSEILAKIWLIGRSYAAAIERGRSNTKTFPNEEFYEKVVVLKIKNSDIDYWFRRLKRVKADNHALILEVHLKVTNLFKSISTRTNRSLASKYLHFHFPDRFFIFDSRADKAIKLLTESPRNLEQLTGQTDVIYRRFFLRCLALHQELVSIIRKQVTPRELDKVLLAWIC